MELPIGIDYAWLACDVDGFIARFTNAGQGPIPTAVLAFRDLADRAEEFIRVLPPIGGHEMRVSLPDSTDFRGSASRGLYNYDWRGAERDYEIVSRPLRPIRAEELPPDMRRLTKLVQFSSLKFSDTETINVCGCLDCVW